MERGDDHVMAAIVAEREAFLRVAERRLGHRDEAEDVLQIALERALIRRDQLQDPQRALSWFHTTLRRAIADRLRQRQRRRDGQARLANAGVIEHTTSLPFDETPPGCACLEHALDAILTESQAEISRRVDLGDQVLSEAAAELDITANTARVRLHRARKRLRQALEERCGVSNYRAAADCTCSCAF